MSIRMLEDSPLLDLRSLANTALGSALDRRYPLIEPLARLRPRLALGFLGKITAQRASTGPEGPRPRGPIQII